MRHGALRALALALLVLTAACSSNGGKRFDAGKPNPHVKVGNPYQINGIWYVPKEEPDYDRLGFASWYGPGFHGRLTANGEVFDEDRLTAAHPTLPLPSIVEVTNPANGRRLILRVNDRGPFANNRILDLSKEAARRLGTKEAGVATVRVRYLGPAKIEEAITKVGERERRQSLALAVPRPPVMKPWTAPERGIPGDAQMILADLDTSVLDRAQPFNASLSAPTYPANYFVQVGAFSDTANAADAAARLPADTPVALQRRQRGGESLMLVRLGPFNQQAIANEALDQARSLGFNDAHIVEEVLN
ncbi:MAG: septal ring lytic transglycosylase RlpA family protein [Pseudomonadota bacterium]